MRSEPSRGAGDARCESPHCRISFAENADKSTVTKSDKVTPPTENRKTDHWLPGVEPRKGNGVFGKWWKCSVSGLRGGFIGTHNCPRTELVPELDTSFFFFKL